MKTNDRKPSADLLPSNLAKMLRQLIHRARLVIVLRGTSATATAFIGALLIVMSIDASALKHGILLPLGVRWALTIGAFTATLATAAWFLLRPIVHSFSMRGIARLLESRHPEFQERISSAVELLSSPDAPEIRGSQAMIDALAREAGEQVLSVQPRREVTLRAARPYLIAAATIFALIGILFLIAPGLTLRRLARAAAPFLNISTVPPSALSVRPGDTVLCENDCLTVSAFVADPRVMRVLFRSRIDGEERIREMTEVNMPEGQPRMFSFTCPAATKSFRYRVNAGDAVSAFYTATVLPRARVTELDFGYTFPAYTQKPAATETNAAGPIRILAGTTVSITARVNRAVSHVQLLIDGKPYPAAGSLSLATASVQCVTLTLPPEMNALWRLELKDVFGFESTSDEYPVQALADAPPVVRVVKPEEREIVLKPTDSLPVDYMADDDYGIDLAELLMEVDGHRVKPRELTPGEALSVALAEMKLRHAREVAFQVRVLDNLPRELKGPQEALSERYVIKLDRSADAYRLQAQRAQAKRVKEQVLKALKEIRESEESSRELRRDKPALDAMNEDARQRIDELRSHADRAETIARDLIPDVEHGAFPGLTEPLRELADEHLDPAEAAAGRIPLEDQPETRRELAAESARKLESAEALAEDILAKLDNMMAAAEKAQAIAELADKQGELADEKQAMETAEAEQKPEKSESDWKKEQDAIAEELAKQVARDPEALARQQADDAAQVPNLKNRAEELAKKQEALQKETAFARDMAELDRQLQELSKQQKSLADETAAQPTTADMADKMRKAAEDIAANELAEAVEQQNAAEKGLDELAGTTGDEQRKQQAEQLRTEAEKQQDLAEAAQQLADDQRNMANAAEQARRARDEARNETNEARNHEQQADQRARNEANQLANTSRDIAREFDRLRNEAAKIEQAAEQTPPENADGQPRPSETLAEGKQQLEQQTPDPSEAAANARQAAEEARTLADAMEQAAGDTDDKDTARKAAQTADKARDLAKSAERLAERADQAARQADRAEDLAAEAKAASELRQQAESAQQQAERETAALAPAQRDLAQQAADLAHQMAESPSRTAREAARQNPEQAMNRAADAMNANDPNQAVPNSNQAAAQADAMARQMAEAARQTETEANNAEQAQAENRQAAGLAQRQQDLRERTEDLLAERQSLAAEEMTRMQTRQDELAADARELAQDVAQATPQQDAPVDAQSRAAADESRQAAAELADGNMEQAAQSAAEAANQLGDLSQSLAESAAQTAAQPPPDAEQGVAPSAEQMNELSARAEALQDEQSHLAEQMSAMAAQAPIAPQLAARQDALATDIADLANSAQLLADHASDLSMTPLASSAAHQAAYQAREAAKTAERASDQMAPAIEPTVESGEQPPQHAPFNGDPTPTQDQAAEQLGRLADSLDELGTLASGQPDAAPAQQQQNPSQQTPDGRPSAPEASPPAASEASSATPAQQLNQAYNAAATAANKATSAEARRAQQLLEALAAMANQQAVDMGVSQDSTAMPAQTTQPTRSRGNNGTGEQPVDRRMLKLRELGLTYEDWARLPGELRDRVLQAANESGSEEYRMLIKRYFQEIARRGSSDGGNGE